MNIYNLDEFLVSCLKTEMTELCWQVLTILYIVTLFQQITLYQMINDT
jgi:hypothetical protein